MMMENGLFKVHHLRDQLRYWEVETADFKEFSFGSLNSALKFEEVKLALLENRIKIVLGKYPEKNWEYLISFFTFEDRTFLLIRDPEDCSRSSSVEL